MEKENRYPKSEKKLINNKNMQRTFEISSVEEYIKKVDEIYQHESECKKEDVKGKHLFFRGHSDKEYKLLPNILRGDKLNEKEILNDFHHYSPRHLHHSYDFEDDRIKILAEMQHNEVPTRLLDWSLAPLNALFFALSENNENGKDAQVIVFNPWKYNSKIVDYRKFPNIHNVHIHARALLSATSDFDYINDYIQAKYRYKDLEKHHIEKPFAFVSNFLNDRILHQRGAFTIHGTDKKDLGEWAEFKDCSWRIIIKSCAKKAIYDMLNKLYINPYSIYPDFPGMKKQINERKGLFNL